MLSAPPTPLGIAMEKQKGYNDFPLDLIGQILFGLPVKSLVRFKCVSKTWLHQISDPNFAKSHFELAAAPTRRCLFIQITEALSYDIHALFRDQHAAVKVSLPCMKPSTVYALESCRGFILLDQCPHLIIWNPSTGAHKRVPYPHTGYLPEGQMFQHLRDLIFFGFGYDASEDDYLVVLARRDEKKEARFDFFSTRTSLWDKFKVAPPNVTARRCGLFLNGAFHWLANSSSHEDYILVFDPVERRFSEIPLPTQRPIIPTCRLMELGGCLALYFWSNEGKFEIWVMKEYKVQSSWTLYGIFDVSFDPLGLSNDGGIIGFDANKRGFSKYNVSGLKVEHCSFQHFPYSRHTVYTESLLSLPNNS